jgi:hypothetical protein
MEPDQLPHRSCHFLKLPLHLESFPSKRCKVTKHDTHTSTYHTCDYTIMSTDSISKDNRSPLTLIPYVVNGTLVTPSAAMVVVSEVPILTPNWPMVSTQPIVRNPFKSPFGMPGFNAQSIPLVSNPFSFGMPNMT